MAKCAEICGGAQAVKSGGRIFAERVSPNSERPSRLGLQRALLSRNNPFRHNEVTAASPSLHSLARSY
jgi:hypothetical protein